MSATSSNPILDKVADSMHEIASRLYSTDDPRKRELADIFCTLGNHISEASIKVAADTAAEKILLELAINIEEVSRYQYAGDTQMISRAFQELAAEIRLNIRQVEEVETILDDVNPF